MNAEAIAENLRSMVETDEERASKSYEGTPAQPSVWLAGPSPVAGVTVTETSALSLSSVFACVRNLGEDEAKLPFIVYRRLAPRGKERFPAHPSYRLLHDEPNPEMSAFDFRQALTACASLWGNGYAEIERTNGGIPDALWPLEPWRVRVCRDAAKRMYYEVDGRTRLEPADMFHIKGFGTDGVLGMMLAQVGRDSLGLAMAAQRFAASFFGNGMRLSGILTHPGTLSDKAAKNLKNSVTGIHVGDGKQHGVGLFEEGMTWTPTSAPPNEAQMLETRQFQIEDVARWFRMPPHKIQHLLRSTFSNIEHQSIEYVVDTLMPWLVRWEQEAKRKLIGSDNTELFAEHLVDGLLRGDIASRYAAYAVGRQNGWLSANDILEKENANPIDGEAGNAYLVNGNMITVQKALANPAPGATPPAPEPVEPETEERSQPDATAEVFAQAHRPALLDAAARAVRREVETIRRRAKKPDGLADSVRSFYASHHEYVDKALRPAVTAYMATLKMLNMADGDTDGAVRSATERHIATATADMLHAIAAGADIEETLSDWESTRSQDIVERIIHPKA